MTTTDINIGASPAGAGFRLEAVQFLPQPIDRVSGECVPEIVAQVLDIFDADAEPDQAVVDAARRPDLSRDACVGHRRRVADQRFDAAQALGQAEEPGSLEQLRGALLPRL